MDNYDKNTQQNPKHLEVSSKGSLHSFGFGRSHYITKGAGKQ
jgi:hypothetical protein